MIDNAAAFAHRLAELVHERGPAASLAAIVAAVGQGDLDALVTERDLPGWLARLDAADAEPEAPASATRWHAWAVATQAGRLLADRRLRHQPDSRHLLCLRAGLRQRAARALSHAGLPAHAAVVARQAAGDAYAAGDHALAGRCLLDEAGGLLGTGRATAALRRYTLAANLLAAVGDPAGQAAALLGRAASHRASHQPDEALPCFVAAETLLATHGLAGSPDAARGLANHAACLAALGRLDEAWPRFELAATRLGALDRPVEQAACLMTWATSLHDAGDITAAATRYRQAQQCCALAGPTADPVAWRLLYNQAALCRPTGDWTRARDLLAAAMPIVDRLTVGPRIEDRLSLRETAVDLYRLAVATDLALAEAETSHRADHWRAAFDHAQQAKGRLLTELLGARVGANATPPSLATVQASLTQGELLLDCLPLSDGLAVFAVTSDSLTTYTVAGPPLTAAVREHEQALHVARTLAGQGGMVSRRPSPALAHLYDLLIAPLGPARLAGLRHLLVVPATPLQRVPLAALWRSVDGAPRYLADDYWLSSVPSAGMLSLLRRRPPPPSGPPSLLAVAPFNGRESVIGAAPLPATAGEIERIAALVQQATPAATVTTLVGPAATVGATLARAPGATLLLIATHGRWPASGATLLDFGLLFAAERPDSPPRLLPLRDILAGGPALDQVVQVALTACHLGRPIERGDEALGFLQALLGAGVRLCLAPLWAVGDAATAHLSVAYHRALLAGAPAAAAHRAAMASVRARPGWGNPFFWAGLPLTGDGALCLPVSPAHAPVP